MGTGSMYRYSLIGSIENFLVLREQTQQFSIQIRDWFLQLVPSSVHEANLKLCFHNIARKLQTFDLQIRQIEYREEVYIVFVMQLSPFAQDQVNLSKTRAHLFIFKKSGELIKQIELDENSRVHKFRIDSKCNIKVYFPNDKLLKYYDLNGDLLKKITILVDIGSQFFITEINQIYFYDANRINRIFFPNIKLTN